MPGPLSFVNPRRIYGARYLVAHVVGTCSLLQEGWTFGFDSNFGARGELCFQVDYDSTDLKVVSAQNTLTLNQWQHLVVTWDGSTSAQNVKIYKDGSQISYATQTDGSTSRVDGSSTGTAIATNPNGGGTNYHNGLIDDVRIYNRVLSPDEIKRLYQIGGTVKLNTSRANDSLSTGLVGWWTFDGKDMAGNYAFDKSGNGNRGTLTGSNGVPVRTIGKLGQAIEFDTDNDYVNIGSVSSLTNLITKTICAWIKPTSFSTRDIVGKYNTGGNGGWLFRLGTNCATGQDLCYYQGFDAGNGYWSTSGGVSLNEWSHVCVTHDRSSATNNPIFYINGISKAVTQTIPSAGSAFDDTGTDFTIGNIMNASDSSFGGLIDDARIYNRALSKDEIKRLYNMGR